MQALTTLSLLLMLSVPAFCQTAASEHPLTTAGSHEVQVWVGGGHGTNGRFQNTSVANLGLRYGWILTDPHGPGFLRGSFEYAVDAVPAFLLFQPDGPITITPNGAFPIRGGFAYGAGVNPVNFKWNFVSKGRWTPYLELSGGTLFSNVNVPPGTSKINFTSGGAIGFSRQGDTHSTSFDIRYMHISNAGLTVPNPGINTIQLRVGFGRTSR